MRYIILSCITLICLHTAAQGFLFPEFTQRHEKAVAAMESNSVLIMRSADAPIHDAIPTIEDANFLYMTGKEGALQYFLLSVEPIIISQKKYHSIFFTQPDAIINNGTFDTILSISEFNNLLERVLKNSKCIYLSAPDLYFRPDWINKRMFYPWKEVIKKLKVRFPESEFKESDALIAGLREIKSDAEIRMIEKAIQITAEGLSNASAICKSGNTEYQLQAEIEYVMLKNHQNIPAFRSIVGSGINALEPHYQLNKDTLKKGELVVIDVGARWNGYCADITRTLPVDGIFSKKQAELYDSILAIQERLIKMLRPGMEISAIDISARAMMNEKGWGKYLIHGVTHSLGLDVHDKMKSMILKEGMVITIEPGIYIPIDDEAWPEELRGTGIRIEDDVLITADSYRILSLPVPKSIKDIEHQMKISNILKIH
ncbi:MAG: Xaa-Pro peptidase family protein [Bacteroidales bacterium]|nr:Xaa-Pro peptidase family protein [Bacteroidales bacterium]